jgi:biofilm protein TabA
MIFDRLANAELYYSLHARFPAAFEFLRQVEAAQRADGEYELDGKRLYSMISTSNGVGRDHAKLESHRRYIDIQYVVRGSDKFGLRPVAECRDIEFAYSSAEDASLYSDRPTNWLIVPSGSFAIFFPEDGHVSLAVDQPVTKAIVKVMIDE